MMKKKFRFNANQLTVLGTALGFVGLIVGKVCEAISTAQMEMEIDERANAIVDERLNELGLIDRPEDEE